MGYAGLPEHASYVQSVYWQERANKSNAMMVLTIIYFQEALITGI
jgi:hypothetical protein